MYGQVEHDTVHGRRVSSHFLDVVRCRIVVNSPRAILVLLEEFFEPLKETVRSDSLVVTQVRNAFHPDAPHVHGYRELVLNVYYNGGDISGHVVGSHKKKLAVTVS